MAVARLYSSAPYKAKVSKWVCAERISAEESGRKKGANHLVDHKPVRRQVVNDIQHPVLVDDVVDLIRQVHGLRRRARQYGLFVVL